MSERVSKFVRGRHGLSRAARAADDQALARGAQLLQCTSRNVRFHRVIWNKCVTAYARCCNRPAIVDAGDAYTVSPVLLLRLPALFQL